MINIVELFLIRYYNGIRDVNRKKKAEILGAEPNRN